MRALAFLGAFAWTLLFAAVTAALSRAAPLGPAAGVGLGPWTPDLALVLLMALAVRMDRGDARAVAAVVAIARAALGVDTPFALLAAMWFAVELSAWSRTRVRVEGRAVHALVVAVAAGATCAWLRAAAALRAPLPMAPERGLFDDTLAAAVATGLVAFLVGRLPARLPGLVALWHKEETWERVGHVRS